MSESQGLGRILTQNSYDAEKFIAKQADKGEEALQEIRENVRKLSAETSVALKKNVYKNYSQFIETAKEIAILETEMYQLSHMLTDQKSIIHSMLEVSVTGKVANSEIPDETTVLEDQTSKNNLSMLLERVEGCTSLLDKPGRYLVHDGDLVERDPESFSHIQKIHAFLMNDCLLFASCLPHRRGPVKYTLQNVYELDGMAVVNAKDSSNCKNAFKILKFPETRLFEVKNSKEKRQWLDILDATKRKKALADSQKKEAAQQALLERQIATDPSNPFAEFAEEEKVTSPDVAEDEFLHLDWVQELPEDLDVCIAQRDFEGAVDNIEKVLQHIKSLPNTPSVKEYHLRIDQRVRQLTDVLLHELELSPERSLRGGPNAARRAVTQLVRLGKSAQACNLFLRNRSSVIKYRLAQLKIEGNTITYIKRLCQEFFNSIEESADEFLKAFPKHFACFSGFVLWAKEELETFVQVFSGQVFSNKASLDSISDCVVEAKRCCQKLSSIGLELTFILEGLLEKSLMKTIKEAYEHQKEAVDMREASESWESVDFGTSKETHKFIESLQDLGLEDVEQYIFKEHHCYLTKSIQSFAQSYSTFAVNMLSLYSEHLHGTIADALVQLIIQQFTYCNKAWNSDSLKHHRERVYRNYHFLMKCLWPAIQQQFFLQAAKRLRLGKDIDKQMDAIDQQFAKL